MAVLSDSRCALTCMPKIVIKDSVVKEGMGETIYMRAQAAGSSRPNTSPWGIWPQQRSRQRAS